MYECEHCCGSDPFSHVSITCVCRVRRLIRLLMLSLFIVLVLFDSFCHPITSWRVTVLKTEVPSYILPPVDLLGQDGRPSTDGGLVVLLLYAHVKNLPWEYDFEFDVLQVVEADNSWPETATWVNYVCMYV